MYDSNTIFKKNLIVLVYLEIKDLKYAEKCKRLNLVAHVILSAIYGIL